MQSFFQGDPFCESPTDRDLTSPIRDHDKSVRHEVDHLTYLF